ncbi:MAG: ChbG/HpnK family deacetylase [Terriglobia bacterium]
MLSRPAPTIRGTEGVATVKSQFGLTVGLLPSKKPTVGEAPTMATSSTGALIVNADDWGRDNETTDLTLECVLRGSVSSVSAMVFMEGSERAAVIARENGIDAGLHLNFTAPFSALHCPARLVEHQYRIANRLLRHRLAQALFYPTLMRSFEYVVSAQLDEFCRLYGAPPERLDGHHHMHLCANVFLGSLLPRGAVVRRNFSFEPGEKGFVNRLYRQVVDRMLARRHRLTDFFFSLNPLEPPGRLQRIFALARRFVVEVETHPVNPEEYRFLAEGEISRWIGVCPIASRFAVKPNGRT